MKERNPNRFFFLRTPTGTPVGVVAMRAREDGEVACAMSLCNPSDVWNRKAGVDKALGRLDSPSWRLCTSSLYDLEEFYQVSFELRGIDYTRALNTFDALHAILSRKDEHVEESAGAPA